MNERIRELARQAGIKFQPMILDGVEYDYEDVDMDGSEDLQKFAELIVQECIEQFAFSVTDNTEIIQDRFTQCRKVAEYFGVSE